MQFSIYLAYAIKKNLETKRFCGDAGGVYFIFLLFFWIPQEFFFLLPGKFVLFLLLLLITFFFFFFFSFFFFFFFLTLAALSKFSISRGVHADITFRYLHPYHFLLSASTQLLSAIRK
jgi:hypothetical protein